MTGAITDHIDVAQVTLYAFWFFFAILILHLRREDRREGYPLLREDQSGLAENPGYLTLPLPKTFHLYHGGTVVAPRDEYDSREIKAVPATNQPGAALIPVGDALLDAVGPGSYALRSDKPDLTAHGLPKIVPLRLANDFKISSYDADPRGFEVIGADGHVGATVRDAWVDRSEQIIRFYEVETANGRRVLLPYGFAQIDGDKRKVTVESILASQFENVPQLASPDQITLLEEEKVTAYYGGGILYADPERQEPFV
jgi:photosynthetic reaction center H subunit